MVPKPLSSHTKTTGTKDNIMCVRIIFPNFIMYKSNPVDEVNILVDGSQHVDKEIDYG